MANIYKYILLVFLCTNTAGMFAQPLLDEVWPGDVNDNGIVNHLDLLYIGAAYNFEGSPRSTPGNTWMSNDVSIEEWGSYLTESSVYTSCDTCTIVCTDILLEDIGNYSIYLDGSLSNEAPVECTPGDIFAAFCISPGFHELKIEPNSYTCTGFLYDIFIECDNQNDCWTGFDLLTQNDGSAQLEPWIVGGVPPYTYIWSDGSTDSLLDLSAIAAGTHNYCLTITDINGLTCESCRDFELGVTDTCYFAFYPAFADCNGNGIVEDSDMEAVDLNYNQTHGIVIPDNFNPGTQGLHPEARLVTIGSINTFEAGQTYPIGLELGTANQPLDFFYGISFTLEFEAISSPVPNTGGNDIFTPNHNWIDDNSEGLLFYENWNGNNELKVTIVRKNQKSKFGFGDIGTLNIVIEDNVPTIINNQPIMRIKDIRQVDEYLNEYPIVEDLLVMDILSSDNPIRTTDLEISPNPVTNGIIYIEGMKEKNLRRISLYDVLGREIPFIFSDNRISIQNEYTGIAFLEIETEEGRMTEKLIIE